MFSSTFIEKGNTMKFNIGKTFLLGFGFFGVSVIWSVYNAYVPVFLEERFNLAAGFIGIFMTLDNIAALFIQPAVGAWSDSIKTRIGRRLPFILVGAPIAALAFLAIPKAPGMLLFFAAATVLLLSMAIWRTPVVALMPDITPSDKRSQANGIINLMGGLGAIIAFIIGASLYEKDPSYPFYLGAGLVVAAALLVLTFIREPKDVFEKIEKKPNFWSSLNTVLKTKDKNELRVLLAIFFWFIAYNGIEAFFTLYSVNYLGMGAADGARLLGVLSLFFVLGSIPAGIIGGKIGRRRTIMIGIVGMMLGVGLIFLLPKALLTTVLFTLPMLKGIPWIGIILMWLGLTWACININSLPMVVDMTDDVHIGTFTGLYYFFSTMAAIGGPIIYGWMVHLTHNRYDLIMMVSPIFLVLAFVSIIGVRRGEAKKAPQPQEG